MYVSIPSLLVLVVLAFITTRIIRIYRREKAEERAVSAHLRMLDDLGYTAGRLGKSPDFYEAKLHTLGAKAALPRRPFQNFQTGMPSLRALSQRFSWMPVPAKTMTPIGKISSI